MPAPASEDDLKRRARRRLIGAVALTLAAVIVLPLLLEDEPPPAGRLEVHMPPVAESPKAVDATSVIPVAPIVPAPEAPIAPKPVPVDKPAEKPRLGLQPEIKKTLKPNATVKTESKSAPVPESTPTAFVVQLGAFSDAAKSAALKSQADHLGLSSYTDKSGALTRLRVGPFATREAAMEAAAKLDEAGLTGQVMPK